MRLQTAAQEQHYYAYKKQYLVSCQQDKNVDFVQIRESRY